MSSGAQCDNCGTFIGSDDPSQWQWIPWAITLKLHDDNERHFCGPGCCAEWCVGVDARQANGHGATPQSFDFPRWPSHKPPRGLVREREIQP